MKQLLCLAAVLFALLPYTSAQNKTTASLQDDKNLYLDVHYLPAGKVKFKDVMDAHQKDLAVQSLYGVNFFKFWVDEKKGIVYCLSSATDSASVRETHRRAHGLLPAEIMTVTDGIAAMPKNGKQYFLDIHMLGAGKVTAADVAAAHEKDLAVQQKHGVNFINYCVNEKDGVVVCLSQAANSSKIVETHREAHGLLPDEIIQVKQGE